MAGPYTQLTDVTGNGPFVYPDQVMDAGTLALIDTVDPWTWPDETIAANAVVGAQYKNFDARMANFDGAAFGFDYAFPGKSAAISGLISYAGIKGRSLLLPDAFKLGTGMKHWAICLWLQMSPTIPSGFNNRLASFDADDGTIQWQLTPTGDGSNVVSQLEFITRAGASSLAIGALPNISVKDNLMNSAMHQLVFEYEQSPDNSKFDLRFYLDGTLRGAAPGITRANDFYANTLAGKARVGCPGTFTGGTFTGAFARAWIEDLTLTNRLLTDMVAIDWQVNKSRLGV